jgi:hypothetical protein
MTLTPQLSGKGCQSYERCHNTHDRNLRKEWTIRPRITYNGESAQILAQKVEDVLRPCHTHTSARNKDDTVYLINATKNCCNILSGPTCFNNRGVGRFIASFKRDVRLINPLIHHFFHYKCAFRYHITFLNTHQMFRWLRPGFLRNSVDQLLLHENLSIDAADGYDQGCTNPGHQVIRSTKICTAAPNMCGSSVWNLLHVTFLAPRILRRLLELWKSVDPWLLLNRCKDYPARAASLLSNEVAFPPHRYKAW